MVVQVLNLNKKAPRFGVRHIQILLLFFAALLIFQQRVNVSVGIVAFTNANTTGQHFEEYDFTEQQKSFMLGSLFWGALLTQVLGGYLSSLYGAKVLLLISVLGCSLLSLFVPWSLHNNDWLMFCVVRLAQGLCQGLMWPCIYTHLAKWCQPKERNNLAGITQTGMDIGTALGFAVSGVLAASEWGWPNMFYVPGMLGIIWSCLWLLYGANSPEESNIISEAERKKLQFARESTSSSTAEALPQSQTAISEAKSPPIPWRAIMTSRPFLILAFCKLTQAFSYHTLMQQLPSYINGVFHLGIRINALLSALPYAFMCIMSYVCLIVANMLTRYKLASLAVIRKSINSLASWVPAAALLVVGYLSSSDIPGNITCLTVAVAATAAQAIGSSFNHIDLSPRYAGVLFGITNTLMSLVGVLSPIIVAAVVQDDSDRSQWRIIFIGIAVILFVGNLLFIMFGEMHAQIWNDPAAMVKVKEAEKPASAAKIDGIDNPTMEV